MEYRLSEVGASKLIYLEDFHNLMKERGIRDPYAAEMEEFKNRIEPTKDGRGWIVHHDPNEVSSVTKEEKEKWNKTRDKYVAARIFTDFGYEAILKEVEFNSYLSALDNISNYFTPCLGFGHQCHFDCYEKQKCMFSRSKESF